MSEIWKSVIGFEGFYEVSNRGRVRSVEREYVCKGHGRRALRKFKSKILALNLSRIYPQVYLSRQGKGTSHRVHVLVLEAFGKKRPPGKVARHLDGTRTGNNSGNLCWGTQAENQADKVRHGNSTRGERNAGAKLTTKKVLALRAKAARGLTTTQLARIYGISRMQTRRILMREKWAHV